ncbi:MAG: hypothetical protein KDI71_00845 [Xanthomonadales bacterium]|nr:hypothetical protein [Xanthomonadales bacterium]
MNPSIKSRIPFVYLASVSIWWAFYYQSTSALNDFGSANFEWFYLLDAAIVAPLCWLCIRDRKEALLKAVVLLCGAILIGSYIIPEQSKFIWHQLENGRYLILAMVLLFELVALLSVYLAVRTALWAQEDPDLAIESPIRRLLGDGPVSKMLAFETRMWTFALFAQRVRQLNFTGDHHFSYHRKDGAQSNLLGFILLIALELPLVHVLLHFLWSPTAANIISLLTAFSLVFFIAEYRAMSRRPVSIDGQQLIIRFGIYSALTIPLSNVAAIRAHNQPVRRAGHLRRYNYAGSPNVAIELAEPQGKISSVYLGMDAPEQLIRAIDEARTAGQSDQRP